MTTAEIRDFIEAHEFERLEITTKQGDVYTGLASTAWILVGIDGGGDAIEFVYMDNIPLVQIERVAKVEVKHDND